MATLTKTRTWTIDTAHSLAEFSAKHMVVSTVKGRFDQWQGEIVFDESDPASASAAATFHVQSINTGQDFRDNHLRSDDFFNAEQFPTMSFVSTRTEVVDATNVRLHGVLTIRDVARPVVLDVEYEGQIKDAYGKQRASFHAQAKINRREFNLNWNGVIESGGVIVGDTIKVDLYIAAVANDDLDA